MKKRGAISVAAAAALWCGAAYAITLTPAIATGTLVIHASGAGTGIHASGGVSGYPSGSGLTSGGGSGASSGGGAAGQVSTPSVISPLQGIVVPAQPAESGSGSAPPAVTGSEQGGFAPAYGEGKGAAEAEGEALQRETKVTLLDGALFTAARMRTGLSDTLRIRNGRTITSVRLARVAAIEFGEKELGALPVTVTLIDGATMEGTIYPGTVFEFEGEGEVTATRASAIATIEFPSE